MNESVEFLLCKTQYGHVECLLFIKTDVYPSQDLVGRLFIRKQASTILKSWSFLFILQELGVYPTEVLVTFYYLRKRLPLPRIVYLFILQKLGVSPSQVLDTFTVLRQASMYPSQGSQCPSGTPAGFTCPGYQPMLRPILNVVSCLLSSIFVFIVK